MNSKTQSTPKPVHGPRALPDRSMRLALIQGLDIRLTPTNAVFVVWREQVIFPYLRDGQARIGKREFQAGLPAEGVARVGAVLRAKQKIRKDNPLDWDEDEAQFNYT